MVEVKHPVIETIISKSFEEGKRSVTKKKKSKQKKAARILKSPRAKGIQELSATKLIQQMGKESGALVREVENPYADPVQDNRSQFFREAFETEKRKAFGGFI